GATWCAVLEELFEDGLTTTDTTDVYLLWEGVQGVPLQRVSLKGSNHIQRFLSSHDFDVIVQMLAGFNPIKGRRFTELHLTTSERYLKRVEKACKLDEPVGAAGIGKNALAFVASVTTIFARQIKNRVLTDFQDALEEAAMRAQWDRR